MHYGRTGPAWLRRARATSGMGAADYYALTPVRWLNILLGFLSPSSLVTFPSGAILALT